MFFCQKYNATNTVLFSTNQIADILYVSDKDTYFCPSTDITFSSFLVIYSIKFLYLLLINWSNMLIKSFNLLSFLSRNDTSIKIKNGNRS